MSVGHGGEDGAGIAGVADDLDGEASSNEVGGKGVVGALGHGEGEVGFGRGVDFGLDVDVEGLKALEGGLDY